MIKIILSGCNGKMGRTITDCVARDCIAEIVAGFDINTESHAGFPVYANPANCNIMADAIIDFSHPDNLAGVLNYAKQHHIPAVIATTGLSEQQIKSIQAAAEEVPIFFSANMSLGISLMMELCRKAAAVLGQEFDIEILEKHHNQKIDSPSGTALMLAGAVKEGLSFEPRYVFERHSVRQKRDKKEIGFASIRGGTIVGEHEVIFAGHDEILTISHSAGSKEIFARGAINAAQFLVGKPNGLYTMADLVKEA